MHLLSLSDNVKIGVLLLSLGGCFLALGVLCFFDAGLLTIGNALLLAGFPCLVGLRKTADFFNPVKRRDRARGIACFFGGIALVFLLRWSVVGLAVEAVGIADMFGNFLCVRARARTAGRCMRACCRPMTPCAACPRPSPAAAPPARRPNIVDTLKLLPVVGPLARSAPVTWLVERIRGAGKRRPPV